MVGYCQLCKLSDICKYIYAECCPYMKEEEYAWLGLRQIKMAKNVFFEKNPFRLRKQWMIPISFKNEEYCGFSYLPKGSIKKLIGRELSWNDEPVELK